MLTRYCWTPAEMVTEPKGRPGDFGWLHTDDIPGPILAALDDPAQSAALGVWAAELSWILERHAALSRLPETHEDYSRFEGLLFDIADRAAQAQEETK